QLFFIQVLGMFAWALEFPVMKRYSKEYLTQHQYKKGEDLQKTLAFCKKLSPRPTTIVNFVEGTRFTLHKALNSNYKHLL
ncbi:acyltransferase, partial [Francisella tularensis subsp. holarctica]|nr:acyltransferase [Francisella tularensis subsp. holarctica]